MDTKIFHFKTDLDKLIEGKRLSPIHAFLDIAQECNHRCWYCYDNVASTLGIKREKPVAKHMSLENLQIVLNSFSKFGIKAVDICGGEPLTHPNIDEFVERIVAKGIQFGLATNGAVNNDGLWPLIAKHADWIRFSLDTTNPDIYKRVRRPRPNSPHIDHVLENIRQLVAHRDQYSRPELTIGVNSVLDPVIIPSIYETALKCKSLGIDYLRFSFVSAGESMQKELYPPHVLEHLEEVLEEIHFLEDNDFRIWPPSESAQLCKSKDFQKCYWSQMTMTIDVEGTMYTCPEMKFDKRFIVGNIADTTVQDYFLSDKRTVEGARLQQCGNCCKAETNKMIESYITQPKNLLAFV